MPSTAARIFVAEAIGTFTLIFVGVLAIYANGLVQPCGMANPAAIGLAHGLAIASLGAISGGHFNPAVTFGFVVTGRLKPTAGLMYWWLSCWAPQSLVSWPWLWSVRPA